MATTPDLTWYDVLGVPRDAGPEQIKTAWRSATDKFEPGVGSSQFRMFNEAADVLLDPARRAAYDETLGDSPTVSTDEVGRPARYESAPPPPPEPVDLSPAAAAGPADAGTRVREPASRRLGLVTLLLAVASIAAVVAAVVLGQQVRTDARVSEARTEAPAAAERAAVAALSYDYKNLPGDRKRAVGYLTEKFGKVYLKNFMQLEKQEDGSPGLAVQTKTVVTSSVLGSGVMDAKPGEVRVLVYVNQVTKKAAADPQILQNRVMMQMEKSGNRWLVADLKSY